MHKREPSLLEGAAGRHLEVDRVAWLTTITDRGVPAPTPIWFVRDGEEVVVFSEPDSRKVHNIAARPGVTLHFNSDPDGQDVVVIRARASVTGSAVPSGQPGYLDKYFRAIGGIHMTVADFDAAFTSCIRLTPLSVWLGPD